MIVFLLQNFDESFETCGSVLYTSTGTLVSISHFHKLPSNVHSSNNYVIYIMHIYIYIKKNIYIYLNIYICHRSVSHLDTHLHTV